MSHAGKVAVLIPAAGSGSRLGGTRKQFRQLGGKPLLVQTLRVFERHAEVEAIILATPADAVASLEAELEDQGITKLAAVVPGGATRQDSVRAALEAVPPSIRLVLVHDAVRPFVEADQVSRLIEAVRTHGAATLVIPVADTLRHGEGGLLGQTVPREGLYRMQTPQGFRRDWLDQAHARARQKGYEGTDDVELVQRAGCPVQMVDGSPHNIKITTPGDWELAQMLWPYWESQVERGLP